MLVGEGRAGVLQDDLVLSTELIINWPQERIATADVSSVSSSSFLAPALQSLYGGELYNKLRR